MTILELTGVIADLTNTAESEVTANFKKNAEGDELKSKEEISQYVKGLFAQKFKSVSEVNLGRAKKEARTEFENEIKQQLGYDGGEQGVAMIQKIVETNAAKVAQATGQKLEDLTEADALKLASVQNLIRGRLSEKEQQIETLRGQLQQIEADRTNGAKREIVQREWLKLNPVLANDANLRERQIAGFMRTVDLDRFKLVEQNGIKGIIPINDSGEQLLDNRTFNPISATDHIRALDIFGFHQQDPSQGSPSPVSAPDAQPNKPKADLPVFENDEQLSKYLSGNISKGEEHLQAVMDNYQNSKKQE